MNPTDRTPEMMENTPDKFELHYRQQLSALVDGELATDEARFMLRRLERDAELSACQERWQLVGDVLRGRASAPAPLDFSANVRQAIAADALAHGPAHVAPQPRARGGWRRWGGGAALAASVAAVALFMAREQLPESGVPEPVIAATAEVVAPVAAAGDTGKVVNDAAGLVAAAPAVAVAAARRQDAMQRRGSATRTQQAARASSVARVSEPQRAVAATTMPVLPANPVSHGLHADPFVAAGTLQARPWPRSTLSNGGAFNASFPARQGGTTFYPFEPRMPATELEPANPMLPQPSTR